MVDFRKLHAEMIAECENITYEEAIAQLQERDDREAAIRAANDGHLATVGIPYFIAQGIKQRDESGHGREERRIVFEVHPATHPDRAGDLLLKVVEGALTGYESWYLDEHFLDRGHRAGMPFYLCAGGMGWSQLLLEADEAERLFAWAGEQYRRLSAPLVTAGV